MSAPVVIKCGGTVGIDPGTIGSDVADLVRTGTPVVVVHGGSAEIRRLGDRLGMPERRLVAPDGVSTRRTDAATLEVLTLALAGSVKPALVTALQAAGVDAVGLTGLDGGLLRARRTPALRSVVDGRTTIVRDDHSGRVTRVRAELLGTLLDAGLVPVVSPPVLAEDGRPVNADADRVAAAVAVAVRACALVLLTGAPGVLADPGDEGSRLARCVLPATGVPPYLGGGMGPKLVAARTAVLGGVGRVVVADGRIGAPVSTALAGAATEIVVAEPAAVGA